MASSFIVSVHFIFFHLFSIQEQQIVCQMPKIFGKNHSEAAWPPLK